MNKTEFLCELRRRLKGLPQNEIEERLTFYAEMIDDRIEEGVSEDAAVRAVGDVDAIVAQILEDAPLWGIVKEKIKKKKKKGLRRKKTWKIVLLAVGSPIWVPLLIAALAVVLALYVSLWTLVLSLWAVFASLAGCGTVGVVVGLGYAIRINSIDGILLLSAGLVCAGLAILVFLGCKAATAGTTRLAGKFVLGVKRIFMGKD